MGPAVSCPVRLKRVIGGRYIVLMKYLSPGSGGRVFGEAVVEDLTTELEHTFDDDLEQSIIDLKLAMDAAHAEFLVRIEEFERRELSRTVHQLTTAAWLRRFCRMSVSQASGTTKNARSLKQMSRVRAKAVLGEITIDGVKQLAYLRDRYPDAFAGFEETFADVATYLAPRDLRSAINHWEQQVNHAGAVGEIRRQYERRSFHWSQTLDGMWDFSGLSDVESGHIVDAALRSAVEPTLLDPQDLRTMSQRRHDAFADICRFWLDRNDKIVSAGGERPHITVTVPYRTLTGQDMSRLPEIGGFPIDPETMRRLACDAGIVRMIIDSDSQPLDVGRRVRTAPSAIRRALEHRDGGCTWAGCGAPVSWCDAHHVIHWVDGGPTSLGNMVLLCRRHHVLTHKGQKPPPEP